MRLAFCDQSSPISVFHNLLPTIHTPLATCTLSKTMIWLFHSLHVSLMPPHCLKRIAQSLSFHISFWILNKPAFMFLISPHSVKSCEQFRWNITWTSKLYIFQPLYVFRVFNFFFRPQFHSLIFKTPCRYLSLLRILTSVLNT